MTNAARRIKGDAASPRVFARTAVPAPTRSAGTGSAAAAPARARKTDV